jgi:hypothetical protein
VVVLPITSNVSSLSIDKARLRARLATLTRDELRDVEMAVEITLGLGPA